MPERRPAGPAMRTGASVCARPLLLSVRPTEVVDRGSQAQIDGSLQTRGVKAMLVLGHKA